MYNLKKLLLNFLVYFNILLYVVLLYLIISLYKEVPNIKSNSIGYMVIYLYTILLTIVGYIACFLLLKYKKISLLLNIVINLINVFFVIFLKFEDELLITIQIVLLLFYFYFFKKSKSGK